jgi:Asp-tRNA(Asn)/Glu-tRNA(Gln) amidotransferase A subunit family amidase
MARTVGDAALMFAAMAGPDLRDPLALPHTGEDWAGLAQQPQIGGLRVAWTPDLSGAAAVDPAIASICRSAAQRFVELGCRVEEASPEVGNIREPFVALNATLRQATLGKYLEQWRDQMDPILVRRIEIGRSLTAGDIGMAEVERSAYYQRLRSFFELYDLLLLPTVAIAAMPLDAPLPKEIAGRQIRDHLDMMIPTFAFNLSPNPAISVPCGWTENGLPVGLQIVGGWRQDALVIRAAAAFETVAPWTDRRPQLN